MSQTQDASLPQNPADVSAGEAVKTGEDVTGDTTGEATQEQSLPEGVTSSTPVATAKLSFADLHSGPEDKEVTSAAPAPAKAPVKFQKADKIAQQLGDYMYTMNPKKAMDPVLGGQWQKTLFILLRGILANQDQTTFRQEWTTVLNVFNENKEGVFHENYIFRFPQHWNLSTSEVTLFRRLVTVIIQTADPEERTGYSSKARLDLVTEGMTEVAKNNFLNYYA